ncbi:peptide deformylase [Streptomyces sp. NPDC093085]|uniref:peptide deformylase n=1 Tax=Streptomyces sp. NPDC093085 TaxID=3155068 RepID=UPI00342A6B0F
MNLIDLVDSLLETAGPAPIVVAGDPVLRRPSAPYDGQLGDERLARLIELMRATMLDAPGVGLAAPQIGIPLRLAVIEDPAEVPDEIRDIKGRVPQPFRVLVNPAYTPLGERVAFFEGCLSVPGYQAVVARHRTVLLHGEDEKGQRIDEEFTGWPARIVQHETDHLDGTLYLDRAESRSLCANHQVAERWAQPTPEHAARELDFPVPSRTA